MRCDKILLSKKRRGCFVERSKVLLNAVKIVVPVLLFVVFCFALLNSYDKKTFFMNYVGFYINFFILVIWFVINKVFSRLGRKEKKSIKQIQELNDVILDEDMENIHIHGGKSSYISYQIFDERKKCTKMITFWIVVIYIPFVFIILGMLPLPCPNFVQRNNVLKDIFCNTTGEQLFELFIMTMASVFNVIYLLLSFYEKGKTRFFVVSLSNQEYKKNIEKINEKYNEIMTNIIVNECVEYNYDNPYYCVEYMIYKKRYRLLYNVAFVLVAMYVLFLISEFLLGVNTIFVTNFPNLLLVAFCMFSTDYYKRGLHHHVELVDDEKNINEGNEYKRITYYLKVEDKGRRSRMLHKEIAVIENSEIRGMIIYSNYRKRLRNKLPRKQA